MNFFFRISYFPPLYTHHSSNALFPTHPATIFPFIYNASPLTSLPFTRFPPLSYHPSQLFCFNSSLLFRIFLTLLRLSILQLLFLLFFFSFSPLLFPRLFPLNPLTYFPSPSPLDFPFPFSISQSRAPFHHPINFPLYSYPLINSPPPFLSFPPLFLCVFPLTLLTHFYSPFSLLIPLLRSYSNPFPSLHIFSLSILFKLFSPTIFFVSTFPSYSNPLTYFHSPPSFLLNSPFHSFLYSLIILVSPFKISTKISNFVFGI